MNINKSTFIYILIFLISQCVLSQISEATSGFRFPLNGNFSNNGGYQFLELATYSGGIVYHPGEDWNQPGVSGGCGTGCNIDKCLDVVATANGKVVYVNTSTWGGIVIQHIYQGQTWYSQYGHIFNAIVNLNQTVSKGQKIAEIGNVGTECAHLHFEIREADHPNPTDGAYWTYGNNGLGNSNNVHNWYESPNSFIPSHPAYNSTITCLFKVNSINLPNGWKFWKTPPIPSTFYTVTGTISNLPGGSHWALYTANSNSIIDPIFTNQTSNTFSFYFSVPVSNPSYPNGGNYSFRLTPQGQPNTIWAESSLFFISSLPTLSINIQPSGNLIIGSTATISWIVNGGIPGEQNGGWVGNIRLQWYQNSFPLPNLAQIPVSQGSYTFTIPPTIQGGTVPGTNFRIAGVNADSGTSIPGGYVSAFTNYFNIVNPTGLISTNKYIPENFELSQNYPNPFNPSTKIQFSIPKTTYTKITIYDSKGQLITILVNDELKPGTYEVDWDASSIASGVYYYKIETDYHIDTKKMVVLK